ncbi:uncharacterized protein [Amphiura filiformis]|uniref:uncharacterized protein n=1 Tax=Amphiura filiformis TaxID=82378 RepID=UPI003B2109B4
MASTGNSNSHVDTLSMKVETQEKEIERLNKEVKKLRKCARGVNVLGRALKETKEENKRLQDLAQISLENIFPGTQDIMEGSTSSPITETTFIKHAGDKSDIMIQSTSTIDDIDDFIEFGDNIDDSSGDDVTESREILNKEASTRNELKPDQKHGNAKETEIEQDERKMEDSRSGEESEDERKMEFSSSNHGDKSREEEDNMVAEEVTEYEQSNSTKNKKENMKLTSSEIVVDVHITPAGVDSPKHAESKANRDVNMLIENVNSHEKSCEDDDRPANEHELKERNAQLREENVALKLEVQKIAKVNNEWEKFWNRKKTTNKKEVTEKDAIIADLQKFKSEHQACETSSCKVDEARISERNSGESEEVSLLTKQHVNNLEAIVEKQHTEITKERNKSQQAQKFARSLLQQNKELSLEVKRLNGTLATKVEQQKSLHLSSGWLGSFSTDHRHTYDDILHETGRETDRKVRNEQNSQNMMTPVDMTQVEQTQMLRSGLEYQQQQDEVEFQQQQHQQGTEQQEVVNDDDDLSVEELKERILLLKEQKHAYESDFRKERRDREDVVGELEKMKEKLEKTKHKLKQRNYYVKQQAPAATKGQLHVMVPAHTAVYPPGYYQVPHERPHLIAHGAVPHDYYWQEPPDAEETPCLCPRYQKAL